MAGSASRVLVLNGPNLGRLGSREPEVYGATSYDDLVRVCTADGDGARAGRRGAADRLARPSWSGWLHEAADAGTPVVLNPAAFTHYSYALRDACAQLTAPLVEVHLTNPHTREEFRHTSVVSGVATGVIAGFGLGLLPARAAGADLAVGPRPVRFRVEPGLGR